MEFHSHIWENILVYLPLQERVAFRLLSKTFDSLVVKTLTELCFNENNVYSEEIACRFGSSIKHLIFDANDINFEALPEITNNVETVTLGDNFYFCDYDCDENASDCSNDSDNTSANKAVLMLQELEYNHLYVLRSCVVGYLENIISDKNLTSFGFTSVDDPEEVDIVLDQLSFDNLKKLVIHAAYYTDDLINEFKEKAKNLLELELVCPGLEGSEPHSFLRIPCLEVVRICLNSHEDVQLCLNNPEDLPRLNKIDIFQEDENVLKFSEFKVWPLVKSLRLHLNRYQHINFKKFFPSLEELSFNLQSASLSQTTDFFASVDNIKSLFVVCPNKFELPKASGFRSLRRLSLNFKSNVSLDLIKWVGNLLPNLIELSVVSDNNKFENAYIETECDFVSLMRFVSSDRLSSNFYEKLVAEAPRLVDVHIEKDWLEKREEFYALSPRVTVSPFYKMEENTFPEFTPFS